MSVGSTQYVGEYGFLWSISAATYSSTFSAEAYSFLANPAIVNPFGNYPRDLGDPLRCLKLSEAV